MDTEAAGPAAEAEQKQGQLQQQDGPQQQDAQLPSTTAVEASPGINADAAPAYHCTAEAGTDAACGGDCGAAEEAAETAYSPAVQYYSTAAGTEAAYATGHSQEGTCHKYVRIACELCS